VNIGFGLAIFDESIQDLRQNQSVTRDLELRLSIWRSRPESDGETDEDLTMRLLPLMILALLVSTTQPVRNPQDSASPTENPKDSPGTMDVWWTDLEKDEKDATRALLNLADRHEEAVAFLRSKLKPLKVSTGQIRALLLKLGSENPSVWRPAFEELEYFDPRLAIDLETLMDHYKEAPGRQRMVEVLSGWKPGVLDGKEIRLRRVNQDGFNFSAQPKMGSWWAEHQVDRIGIYSPDNPKKKWTRAVRAILLLEHIGTPGAVAILKDMATGHPDAQPTKVARDCLKRLVKSGKSP